MNAQKLEGLKRDLNGALIGELLSAKEYYVDVTGIAPLRANRVANEERGLPNVPASLKTRDARVAIVGYGPSLLDTWEELRDFDGAIWTTSKAHDFLVEREIHPTFHTDVDFREHKIGFLCRPSARTTYILNLGVAPGYLDKLHGLTAYGFNVLLPSGGGPYSMHYTKYTARFDAGLQAAEIAYQLGYRRQTWYGIDCSYRGETTHAGSHSGIKWQPERVSIAGKAYDTSAMLIRQVLDAELLLRERQKLVVRITGDGLLRPFLCARGRVKVV